MERPLFLSLDAVSMFMLELNETLKFGVVDHAKIHDLQAELASRLMAREEVADYPMETGAPDSGDPVLDVLAGEMIAAVRAYGEGFARMGELYKRMENDGISFDDMRKYMEARHAGG